MSKVCKKCGVEKDESEFRRRKETGGFRNTCKQCQREYDATYKVQNKARLQEASRQYRQKNRDTITQAKKEYCKKNSDKVAAQKAAWYYRNRKRLIQEGIQRAKRRRHEDELYRLECLLRNRIASGLKGNKSQASEAVLGASWKFVLAYLGPKPGPDYHHDHICPLAQGKTIEEKERLCHYTNLQWLPAHENLKKRDTATEEAVKKCRELLGREWIYD